MRIWVACIVQFALCTNFLSAADSTLKIAPLTTKWAKDVKPDKVLPEYPRPQLVRKDWLNLNGLWSYSIQPKAAVQPGNLARQILVPFPIESELSRVMERVDENQRLWYSRKLEIPASWADRRILLHFGAVDWEAQVIVNGKEIGTHRGGYDPFTFDITDSLKPGKAQELVVAVWDPTDNGFQARGKQVRHPESIWYTPTTGIWQTVWLEPVNDAHIEDLRITPDVDQSRVLITIDRAKLKSEYKLRAVVSDGQAQVAQASGTGQLEINLPNPKLWSPENPNLYDLKLTLVDGENNPLDEVSSYFGMRKISIGPGDQGITRILLNNKALFQFGPLDQGFWPDGLYTAPTDDALRYDVEITRKLGFNMTRKHVKVEPQRWYYWCDKLGLLVWQDMPSGDLEAPKGAEDLNRNPISARQFEIELERMIATHFNSPGIVMWVPFNEGWGQFDTRRITELVKTLDPTRLVNNASGWTDRQVGNVHDIHVYPGPGCPQPEPKRAAVLGEFGGLGLPIRKHTWQSEKNWGYKSYTSAEDLNQAYLDLVKQLRILQSKPGLSAAVYTQLTDVEIEVNGMLTYDRSVIKMNLDRISAANRRLYAPPPTIISVLATSQERPQPWRYSTSNPGSDWFNNQFNDSNWSSGLGGFASKGTPGIKASTTWQTSDIWLRAQFQADTIPTSPHLQVYHDEDCEIYLNGNKAAALTGYVTDYLYVPISADLLKKGSNLIAVHCRQTVGGQGIDVGVIDFKESPD